MSMIPKYLDKCDMLLLMTVHPGFGGQAFMPEVLDKIRFARETCDRLDIRSGGVVPHSDRLEEQNLPPFDIQVDGGINEETGRQCAKAGANLLVAGSHLFKAPDMGKAVEGLRQAAQVIREQ